jgi:hypothetical protein
MPNHVFIDENRNELPSVMNSNGHAHHVRDNRRTSRPSFDDLSLLSLGHQDADLSQKFLVDEGPFSQRPSHGYLLLLLIIKRFVLLFFLVLYPFVGTPVGETGCRPPFVFPSPPP